ncbi:uncharacterized protein [Nicotiana tomentosiformis]|uniref:uncharacterized protein isoform X2 n=1 Tax=Nicotiana tomentosiformis TaxID=4098 RepID=UPI00388CDE88
MMLQPAQKRSIRVIYILLYLPPSSRNPRRWPLYLPGDWMPLNTYYLLQLELDELQHFTITFGWAFPAFTIREVGSRARRYMILCCLHNWMN